MEQIQQKPIKASSYWDFTETLFKNSKYVIRMNRFYVTLQTQFI